MTNREWVNLVEAIAWPVAIIVIAVVLRPQIGEFISGIAGRATKVSVMSVSIEFAVAAEAVPSAAWRSDMGGELDIRGLVPSEYVTDSYFHSLQSTLTEGGTSDYLLVDLKGDTHEWLSSRLYLFSYMLSNLKGLRAVVFVGTREDVARTYFGMAPVGELLRALEVNERRFLHARLKAEDELIAAPTRLPYPDVEHDSDQPNPLDNLRSLDEHWRSLRGSESYRVLHPAQRILKELQRVPRNSEDDPPPGWLRLPSGPAEHVTWEPAQWIVSSDLTNGFLRHVIQPHTRVQDDSSWDDTQRALRIARTPGDFVALTTDTGRFDRLVDRRALLEAMGAAAAKPGR